METYSNGPFMENTYLINNGTDAIVIDPGEGLDSYMDDINKYDVKAILLTHGHIDHIDGLHHFLDKDIYICESELDFFKDPHKSLYAEKLGYVPFELSKLKLHLLKDNDSINLIGFNIKCLHTPGHTIGSMCYLFNNSILFSGDTLFQVGVGRTDFETGDMSSLVKSLERLKNLPDKTIVYPGHGVATTISFEKKYNPFLR
jgi:glyoxylase-like metal-dependent hydrolase (beta-lactamase superfamily II)